MKRVVKYFIVVLVVLVCIYGFWLWLQYKWATVIKKNTTAVITQLHEIHTLKTASMHFTKTIEWEQELSTLLPGIGIDQIINSALFKDKMVLDVEWDVNAGYIINDITEEHITVSRDGTVTIILGEPEIFWVDLSWENKTTQLGITTKKEIEMEQRLREKASEMMIQEALSWGILEKAKNNAQTTLQDLLLKAQIQIKEVIIAWTGNLE